MSQTKRSRLQISERDLDWFELAFDYKNFLTWQQAWLLHANPNPKLINPKGQSRQGQESIRRRFIKLTSAGYFHLVRQQHENSTQPVLTEPALYAPTEKAARKLISERGWRREYVLAQVEKVEKYLETDTLKHWFLHHREGINNFRTYLTLALREHPTADWYYDEGEPCWSEYKKEKKTRNSKVFIEYPIEVKVPPEVIPRNLRSKFDNKYNKTNEGLRLLGKEPDAEFILRPDKNSDHTIAFIYEHDRGTEDHDEVTAKLFTYYHFYDQKQHFKRYGTPHLRVLIETAKRKTDRRLNKMIVKLREAIKAQGSGIFWFTNTNSIDHERPQSILDPIWINGHERHANTSHSMLEFFPVKN